jgi:hypothetical protein
MKLTHSFRWSIPVTIFLCLWACAKAKESDKVSGAGGVGGIGTSFGGAISVGGATTAFGGNPTTTGIGGDAGETSTGVGGSAGEDSGSGGASGSGGVPPDVIANADVVLLYKIHDDGRAEMGSRIFAQMYLRNQSTDPLPLNATRVRYWFDPDGHAIAHNSYYKAELVSSMSMAPGDDGEFDYMEMSFASGEIPPGNGSELWKTEFQMTIDTLSTTDLFDQSNDHSYAPSLTGTEAEHDKVTVYLADTLVWGCEPSGTCAGDMGEGGAGGGGGSSGAAGEGGSP